MYLVTQTEVLAETFGNENCVRILKRAGFDGIDWSFFEMTEGKGVWCADGWKEHARYLKKVADECGIAIVQAHAPFPSSKGEEPFDTVIMQRILRSMQAAALMGVEKIVVHPRHHLEYGKNRQKLWEENLAFYRSLIPYCEEYGIKVCTENMWQYDNKRRYIVDSFCSRPEEFCALLDELDSPWITGCLDLGHCALVGIEPQDFIRAMGKDRLGALHVQDVDYLGDCHTLPFMRQLEWEEICAALAQIDYEGNFTFEADEFLRPLPPELQPDASAFMEKTGRYLMARMEAKKTER